LQAQVAERIQSAESEPFALLLIDLDRFKEINDTFGHHHGDLLLQEIGPRLDGALTSADLIARLGGDEFGILLHHADTGEALESAQALLHALNDVFVVEGHQLHVGASIGVVVAPDQGSDPDTLLRRADVAMYVAKSGHLGAALYAPEADEYSPDKLTLVGDLRQALEEEQLVLHFQPKVNLATGCADSAEALVRWQHPRRGMIRPDVFIGLAEHTGLIKPLTQYVLNAALRELSTWLAQGWDLSLAVNASVQDLHEVTFPAIIATLLEKHAVPARHLRIEITEGAAMADIARTETVLARIKELGVGVSLDDFGTGYSSLAYLKRLPIDELKVDRSFVRNLASDAEDAAIVRSTIALGHELGMTVTAEGAEDMAAVRVLSDYHCDRIQGYVFSKPLAATEFIAWLTARQQRHTTALAA
jgi:diguanylate cyclase (GGDEF)-like protein